MDRDASFYDAKRLYLESCGDPVVTNTYLKIALALSLSCARPLRSSISGRFGPFRTFDPS